jgi:hypothetical protein
MRISTVAAIAGVIIMSFKPEVLIMWRQGDVFIAPTSEIPDGAERLGHCVLAEGELTGHSHRIDQPGAAELFERSDNLYLRVLAESAMVVHDEHHSITLLRGCYRVWRQREFRPRPGQRMIPTAVFVAD